MSQRIAVVHLDESCLGNGREGATPGGAGGLIEVRTSRGIERRDVLVGDPDTTNNRMALTGAVAVLELLGRKETKFRALFVSDSEYLVKGIREWAPSWERRGWTRKGGAIENLELWQSLVSAARKHDAQWTWVRGHKGHAKNEYANDLAVKAAKEQITSDGAVESGFAAWMAARREKKMYLDYDADATFSTLEERLAMGEKFLLREEA